MKIIHRQLLMFSINYALNKKLKSHIGIIRRLKFRKTQKMNHKYKT